jgi:hypothetical protein
MSEPIERVIWVTRRQMAQWELLQCPVFEVLFGGTGGGGDSGRVHS